MHQTKRNPPQKTFNNGRKARNAPEEERLEKEAIARVDRSHKRDGQPSFWRRLPHAPQNPIHVPERPLGSGIERESRERTPSIGERERGPSDSRFFIFTAPRRGGAATTETWCSFSGRGSKFSRGIHPTSNTSETIRQQSTRDDALDV